jgi:hypothetical protein
MSIKLEDVYTEYVIMQGLVNDDPVISKDEAHAIYYHFFRPAVVEEGIKKLRNSDVNVWLLITWIGSFRFDDTPKDRFKRMLMTNLLNTIVAISNKEIKDEYLSPKLRFALCQKYGVQDSRPTRNRRQPDWYE